MEIREFMHFNSTVFVVWNMFVKLRLSPNLVFLLCHHFYQKCTLYFGILQLSIRPYLSSNLIIVVI